MTARADNQKNNDTMLKVVALICALLLWFYAEAQENPSKERQLSVPVQYVNLAEEFVVESSTRSVTVTVKGNETDIMSLRSDDFTAVVDLSGASIGTAAYPVKVTGADVIERFTFSPEKVNVSLDQIQQKKVPIRLRTEGTVAEGYELKHTDVHPDMVTIRGKSKLLTDISGIETATVNISGLSNDTTRRVQLTIPDGITVLGEDGNYSSQLRADIELYIQMVQPVTTQQALTVTTLPNDEDSSSG